MNNTKWTGAALALLLAGSAFAQMGGMPPITDDMPIYGSQMMTAEERLEHRNRMRAATTLEEREQIRTEHHQQMVTRARERGITLPDEPPARARGQGPDAGMMQGPGAGMMQGPGPMMNLGGSPMGPGGGRQGAGR